jgi:hypothetical protein
LEAALGGDGPYKAESVSGDVQLGLRPGTGGAAVTFQSLSGDATVEPPFRKTDRRAWRVGDGGPTVSVKSVSGDLRARLLPGVAEPAAGDSRASAADAPTVPIAPVAPVPPAPPAPPVPPVAPAPPAAPAPAATFSVGAASEPTSSAPVEPSTPVETAAEGAVDEETRLAVLQAVERGEIDVEEALRRLEPPEAPPGP